MSRRCGRLRDIASQRCSRLRDSLYLPCHSDFTYPVILSEAKNLLLAHRLHIIRGQNQTSMICHPERSHSQPHREWRSRRTCCLLTSPQIRVPRVSPLRPGFAGSRRIAPIFNQVLHRVAHPLRLHRKGWVIRAAREPLPPILHHHHSPPLSFRPKHRGTLRCAAEEPASAPLAPVNAIHKSWPDGVLAKLK